MLGEGGVGTLRHHRPQGGEPLRRQFGGTTGPTAVGERLAAASAGEPGVEGAQMHAVGAGDLGPRQAVVDGGDGPLAEVGGGMGSHPQSLPYWRNFRYRL